MAIQNLISLRSKKPRSGLRQSGNIFFALFGAVALVGVVGVTASSIMSGPMKSMTNVSNRALSESQMMTNMRLAVMGISQPGITKDCDLDGLVEPIPYKLIPGQTPPFGGGFLPDEVYVSSRKDAWGSSYGYCVWDHGTLIDDSDCGGAGQHRQPGLDVATHPAANVGRQTTIAVISSGANRTFETRCEDWASADLNSDGDVDDSSDKQLANKPVGSDDLVMTYSYGEASLATSSNWKIQNVGAAGTPATACGTIGYTLAGGRCYKLGTSDKTWAASRASCQADGADLVTINSSAENILVSNLRYTTTWIGLTDEGHEGVWPWVTASTYYNWDTALGQPDNAGGTDNCARLSHGTNFFDDTDCGASYDYMCEMAGVVLAPGADVRTGLLAEYKFDENTGTTSADGSGNNNPLTISGAPGWVPGKNGSALDFNGTTQYAGRSIGNLSFTTPAVTVSAWFKADVTTGTRRILSAPGNETSGTEKFSLMLNNNFLEFWLGTTGDSFVRTPFIDTSSWHQAVGVYDGATMKIYLDGALAETINSTGNIKNSTSGNFQIGRYGPSWGQYFDGAIDEVRVYDRALDVSEVSQIYAQAMSGGSGGSSTLDVEMPEDRVEVGGNTTISGGVVVSGGLKLADQTNSGVCNEPNDLSLRVNNTASPASLEICHWDGGSGDWVTISGGTSGSNTLEDGLVAHWDMEETSGTSVADSAGTNTGTWTGGTGAVVSGPGKVNKAVNFNGASGRITAPANAVYDNLDRITISAWIYPRSSGEGTLGRIISKTGNQSSTGEWQLYTNGTQITFYRNGWATTNGQWRATVGSLNTWGHIVVTYDKTSTSNVPKIYYNGVPATLIVDSTPAGAFTPTSKEITIGNQQPDDRTFDGMIDDVRIYNRTLSAAEAAQLYLTTKGAGICSGTGYSLLNGRCYKKSTGTLPWATVVSTCASEGADIVSINNTAEFDTVNALRGTSDVWTSYSDLIVEGSWVWGDSTSTYTNWGTSQPNGGGTIDCGQMANTYAGKFDDADCALSKTYICEKPPTSSGPVSNAALLAWWKLDETSGTTVADSAGTNTGTWLGGANVKAANGKVDGALNFTNTTDYIDVGNGTALMGSKVTVAAWIYPRAYNGTGGGTSNIVLTYPTGLNFYLAPTTRSINVNSPTTGTLGGFTGAVDAVPLNTWSHVAFVYDRTSNSNRPRMYVNGNLIAVSQFSIPTGVINTPNNFVLSAANSSHFDGFMDDIRIYGGLLSSDEIKALYTQGQKPVGQAARERFTANQKFAQSSSSTTGSTMDYFGTGVALQTGKRGDEAGVGFRIDSTQTDTSIVTAAVTGVLAGNSGQGALNFKTLNWDTSTLPVSRVTMDHTGGLGIGTVPSRALSSRIQINDTATAATAFNPARGNCTANKSTTDLTLSASLTTTSVSLWSDGKYIYSGESAAGVKAYRKVGGTLVLAGSIVPTGNTTGVYSDGTYVYAASNNLLSAYTFNGTTFTLAGSFTPTPTTLNRVWGDGTYIYAGYGSNGIIKVLSFNGTTFTELATDTPGSTLTSIWGDGSYIYATTTSGGAGLAAYTFDGSQLKRVASLSSANGAQVWGDGSYLYAARYGAGLSAYSFDGNAFTLLANIPAIGGVNTQGVWSDGNYIYSADVASGVSAYRFNGTAFTRLATYDSPNSATWVWGDGANIYVSDANAIITLNGFECTALSSFNAGYQRGILATGACYPSNPKIVATSAGNPATNAVQVGNYVYSVNGPTDRIFITNVSNPLNPIVVGSLIDSTNLDGAAGITVVGNYAYVAAATANRLTIVNISNPAAPVVTGSVTQSTRLGGAWDVAVSGNYAYVVASTQATFTVVNISNPAAPVIANSGNAYVTDFTNMQSPKGVAVSGNYAYVSSSVANKFNAINISNPLVPVIAFTATDGPGGERMKIVGNYAYMAGLGSFRMTVYNLEVPAAPAYVAQMATGSSDLAISGNYALIPETNDSKLNIASIANPALPVVIGSTPGSSIAGAATATVFGRYVYIAGSANGYIVDLGCDPQAGNVTGYFGARGTGANTNASILYSNALRIQDTTVDGSSPVTTTMFDSAGTMSLPSASLNVLANGATHFGFYTYSNTAAEAGKIRFQRTRGTPSIPTALQSGDLIGGLTFTGYNGHANSSLATSNGNNAIMGKVTAAVSAGSIPVDLYFGASATSDASNSSQMVLTNTKRLGIGNTAPTQTLDVTGAIGFDAGLRIGMDSTCATAADAGVLRMNSGALEYCNGSGTWASVITGGVAVATTTEAPNLCPYSTGYLRARGSVTHAALGGATDLVPLNSDWILGLGSSGDNLVAINITDPDAPTVGFNGNSSYIDNAQALAVAGNYVFIASGTGNYFTVYNAKNPASGGIVQIKNLLAGTTYINNPRDMKIKGNYAFVSNAGNDRISVFDITDPYNPVAAAFFTNANLLDPEGMFISGDYLYVAVTGDSRLMILNISNPLSITLVGTVKNAANMTGAMDVEVIGNYAYVAAEDSNILSVVDVSTPATPAFITSITDTALSAFRLTGVNNNLYMTTDNMSLTSIDVTGRTNPVVQDTYRDTTDLDDIWAVAFTGKYLAVSAGTPSRVTLFDIGCDAQPPVDWTNAKKTETRVTGVTVSNNNFYGAGTGRNISGPYSLFGTPAIGNYEGALSVVNNSTGVHERWIYPVDNTTDAGFAAYVHASGNLVLLLNELTEDWPEGAFIYNVATGAKVATLVPGTAGAGAEGFQGDLFGKYAVLGDPIDSGVATEAGAAFVFDAMTGAQLYRLAPTTLLANDNFGQSVSLSENYLAVKATRSSNSMIYIYDLSSRALLRTITVAGTSFGQIEINGDYLLVGSPKTNVQGVTAAGLVYVYDISTGTLVHTLYTADPVATRSFGENFTVSGKYASILAWNYTNEMGDVYIFDVSSGNQIAKIADPAPVNFDMFGLTASIQNNLLSVGAAGVDTGKGTGFLYYGATTDRLKSDVDCYPQPFDFRDLKGQNTSTSVSTLPVKLSGITGTCNLTVSTEAGTISMTKNGVAVTGLTTQVKTNDKIIITLTTPATNNASYKTVVRVGDQSDTFAADTNTGFFVMSYGQWNGLEVGGLSGADAKCLSDLNTQTWKDKSSAGTLTASRVRAFLCDGSKCNNLAPTTRYTFARANWATTGGASFVTTNTSAGPSDSSTWDSSTTFGAADNYWTNRASGTATAWPTTGAYLSGSATTNCSAWTSNNAAQTAQKGNAATTNASRWNQSASACNIQNYLLCMVDPQ